MESTVKIRGKISTHQKEELNQDIKDSLADQIDDFDEDEEDERLFSMFLILLNETESNDTENERKK